MWFLILLLTLLSNNCQLANCSKFIDAYYVWADGAMGESSDEKIKSLQATVAVPEEFVGMETSGITICVRIMLQNARPSCLFDVAGIRFFFSDPNLGYGFVEYENRYLMFLTRNQFQPRQFFHLCVSLNNSEQQTEFKMIWNEYVLVDEVYLAEEAFSTNFTLSPKLYFGSCLHFATWGLPNNMTGTLTDVQVFDQALEVSEMKQYTFNCKLLNRQGFSNISYLGKNVIKYPVEKSFICGSDSNNFLFPLVIRQRLNYDKARRICDFLGGHMIHPLIQKNGFEIMKNLDLNATNDFGMEDCKSVYWVPFVQLEKDVDTTNISRKTYEYKWYKDIGNINHKISEGDDVIDIEPWALNQPNGLHLQRCVGISFNEETYGFYDLDCSNDQECMMCSVPAQEKYTLRGLNPDIDADRDYKLNYYRNTKDLIISFSGYKQNVIKWDWKTNALWLEDINTTKIFTSEQQGLPFGDLTATVIGEKNNFTTFIKFTRVSLK